MVMVDTDDSTIATMPQTGEAISIVISPPCTNAKSTDLVIIVAASILKTRPNKGFMPEVSIVKVTDVI